MKRIKYTIYTENTPQLRGVLERHLSDYTIFVGEAMWQGTHEQSATVIHIADKPYAMEINNLIHDILVECKQNSVYLEIAEIRLEEFTKEVI